jgi:hypothetical protein
MITLPLLPRGGLALWAGGRRIRSDVHLFRWPCVSPAGVSINGVVVCQAVPGTRDRSSGVNPVAVSSAKARGNSVVRAGGAIGGCRTLKPFSTGGKRARTARTGMAIL